MRSFAFTVSLVCLASIAAAQEPVPAAPKAATPPSTSVPGPVAQDRKADAKPAPSPAGAGAPTQGTQPPPPERAAEARPPLPERAAPDAASATPPAPRQPVAANAGPVPAKASGDRSDASGSKASETHAVRTRFPPADIPPQALSCAAPDLRVGMAFRSATSMVARAGFSRPRYPWYGQPVRGLTCDRDGQCAVSVQDAEGTRITMVTDGGSRRRGSRLDEFVVECRDRYFVDADYGIAPNVAGGSFGPTSDGSTDGSMSCVDGSVSHASHARGACSHHGGLAKRRK